MRRRSKRTRKLLEEYKGLKTKKARTVEEIPTGSKTSSEEVACQPRALIEGFNTGKSCSIGFLLNRVLLREEAREIPKPNAQVAMDVFEEKDVDGEMVTFLSMN